jgi:hypothetical protein
MHPRGGETRVRSKKPSYAVPRVMICQRCQSENPPNATFCDTCGARLETACPNCGEPNRRTAKFCRNCGQAINQTATSTPTQTTTETPAPETYVPKHLAEKILARGTPLKANESRSRFYSQTYEVPPACSRASIPKWDRRSSIRCCR